MRFVTDPCPPDQGFKFRDGTVARSLAEFRGALAQAPSDVVQYHREHFPHWVRDILGEPGLAERVKQEGQRAADPEQLRRNLLGILDPYVRSGTGPGGAPAGAGAAGVPGRREQAPPGGPRGRGR